MSWFFFIVIVWFALSRWRRGWVPRARLHGCGAGRWVQQQRHGHVPDQGSHPVLQEPPLMRRRPAVPSVSRYEALKRRYVGGELNDEQYEQAIDALLREPGGMKEV